MTTQHNIRAQLVDLPEIPESFGNAIRSVWFDGTWRIDIDVIRLDNQAKQGGQMTTSQYPACRLVLTPEAGIVLLQRLTELVQELEANGTLKRTPPQTTPSVTH